MTGNSNGIELHHSGCGLWISYYKIKDIVQIWCNPRVGNEGQGIAAKLPTTTWLLRMCVYCQA